MASYEIGKLVWQITGDTSGIEKSIKNTDTGAKGLTASFAKTAIAVGGAILAMRGLASAMGTAVKRASDLQETTNKFDVVFKSAKTEAYNFAKILQDSYGLAKEESMAFLAGTGDILTGLGMQADAALELSNSVATLGIDLASFSNVEGGAERAIAALTSALTGEREALKAYGIVVSEELVKAELLKQGKDKLTGAALNQAKAEATIAIALSQSGNAIGDMARSFDSFANIQRRINSRLEDTQANIGNALLPSLSNLGLAFLSASEDGGFLSVSLNAITKYIASVINGLAVLTVKLDAWKAASAADDLKDAAKNEFDLYKQRLKAQEQLRFGQLSFNEAVKAGIPAAVKVAEETEKTRLRALAKSKAAIQGSEFEREKLDTVMKVQQRIAEGDKVLESNSQAIQERKKERLKEDLKGNKDKNKAVKEDTVKTLDEIKEAERKNLAERINFYNGYAQQIGGQITGLLSAFQALYSARTQADIDSLDAQMQAELEAAGVSEETTLEQAQREYDIAVASGSDLEKEEKRRALVKAQIEAKYQKEKAKLEYENAHRTWEFQRAIAALQIPLAIMSAIASGAQAPWPTTPFFMAAYGAIAGATAGAQFGAVVAAEPKKPKFASGGIIPGSAQGTQIIAGEGNRTELVSNPDQMANILSAIGNGAGVGGGTRQLPPMSKEDLFNLIWNASQNGDLYIAERALVKR